MINTSVVSDLTRAHLDGALCDRVGLGHFRDRCYHRTRYCFLPTSLHFDPQVLLRFIVRRTYYGHETKDHPIND